ncbi:MAG: hypothetical protein ACFE85_10960 [Candidatus Hodarchaeota archaeon]
MEEGTFIKDSKPYLIFCCSKCKQFSYVKTTQKTTKCLRCGRTHQVQNIIKKGEIVHGMSAAVKIVQEKQNEIGVNESNGTIVLSSDSDFIVASDISQKLPATTQEDNYSAIFNAILEELFIQNKIFPRYMMEIMAENYGIPASEVKLLIREFRNKGILIVQKNKNYYYTLKT